MAATDTPDDPVGKAMAEVQRVYAGLEGEDRVLFANRLGEWLDSLNDDDSDF